MNRKLIAFSVVAAIVALGFCNLSAEHVRACDDCNYLGAGYGVDNCAVAPMIALTYPEPYNGEEVKKSGLTIQVRPSLPPRPAPHRPRWIPVRPAPPRRTPPPPPRW